MMIPAVAPHWQSGWMMVPSVASWVSNRPNDDSRRPGKGVEVDDRMKVPTALADRKPVDAEPEPTLERQSQGLLSPAMPGV